MKVSLDLCLEFDYILCSVISKAKRMISVKCANVSCVSEVKWEDNVCGSEKEEKMLIVCMCM